MTKRVDHGLAKPKKKRPRPAPTHRTIQPEQTAAERARVPQSQLAPDPGADTPAEDSAAQDGSQKKARRRRVKK